MLDTDAATNVRLRCRAASLHWRLRTGVASAHTSAC